MGSFATINAAWRRHKMTVKEKSYKPYSDDTDRLLNRPVGIREDHFKGFLKFVEFQRKWQRHMHTSGRTSFAVVRQKLQVAKEDKEPPLIRVEMFIATRERKKAQMTELQSQDVGESSNSGDPFAMVMLNKHAGRVPLEGRGVTKTDLKSKLSSSSSVSIDGVPVKFMWIL
ncbi:hypothetical protein AKJ16_DCAP00839 [Drosera capensis]